MVTHDPTTETPSRYEEEKLAIGEKAYVLERFGKTQQEISSEIDIAEQLIFRDGILQGINITNREIHPGVNVQSFYADAAIEEWGANPDNVRDVLYMDLGLNPLTGKGEIIMMNRYKENAQHGVRPLLPEESDELINQMGIIISTVNLCQNALHDRISLEQQKEKIIRVNEKLENITIANEIAKRINSSLFQKLKAMGVRDEDLQAVVNSAVGAILKSGKKPTT